MILDGRVTHSYEDIKLTTDAEWAPLFEIQEVLATPTTKEEYDLAILKLDSILSGKSAASSEIQAIAEQVKKVYSYDMEQFEASKGAPQS